MPETYDVIIIGGGPAGLAAALYASRGRYRTLVIEKGSRGGQLAHTPWVEDYPGLPDGLTGPDLGQRMWEQALRFDAESLMAEATGVRLEQDVKVVATSTGEYRAKALVVATGSVRMLPTLPDATGLLGQGVYDCALCNQSKLSGGPVAVMGGGDAALSEALHLGQRAQQVTLINEDSQLTAFEGLQDRVLQDAKIEVRNHTSVQEIRRSGNRVLISLREGASGAEDGLEVEAVFIAAAFLPNTGLLKGLVSLNAVGEAVVDEWMHTPVPGLFAAGDLRAEAARMVVAAAGDGATAAIAAGHYLDGLQQG